MLCYYLTGRLRQWFTIEAAVSALHKPLQSHYVKLLLPPDHHYHSESALPYTPPINLCPVHREDAHNCDTISNPNDCPSSTLECVCRRVHSQLVEDVPGSKVRRADPAGGESSESCSGARSLADELLVCVDAESSDATQQENVGPPSTFSTG